MDKHEIIELLRRGEYVSGAELGRSLGVTRAAVSKAIAALKREGYGIESVPNRGHRLLSEPDRLDRAAILAALGDHPWADRLELLSSVDSTNNYLKARASQTSPAKERCPSARTGAEGSAPDPASPHSGAVAVAEAQTAGRGRLGRSFDSAPGAGSYLSVLLHPACPPAALMTLTARAAVAVRRAIREAAGVEAGIKWVNDLVLNGKKICGILTELSVEAESGLVSYAVVGVGINCNRPAAAFPPELRSVAGSILSETGKRVDRNALTAALIRALSELPGEEWLTEYRAACVNLGRPVQILAPGRPPRPGTALDVGPNAELLVQTETGVEAVRSGEVSVRGMYGYMP